MNIRSFVTPLAAALALAFVAVPTVASAEEAPEGEKAQLVAKKGKHKGQKNRLEFPMKAEKFSAFVDRRLAKARARVQRNLANHDISPEVRKAILADLELGTQKIQSAADQAEADGTVTKQEAKQVRQVARRVRKAAGEKYGNELGRNGKSGKKGKGHRKGKKGQKRPGQNGGNGPRS